MNITTVFSILSVGTHYLLLLVLVKLPLSTADSQQVSSQVTTTVKGRIAVNGFPSHSYGTSLAIWDHTVLSATRHK